VLVVVYIARYEFVHTIVDGISLCVHMHVVCMVLHDMTWHGMIWGK
jgi:hypothetical protein